MIRNKAITPAVIEQRNVTSHGKTPEAKPLQEVKPPVHQAYKPPELAKEGSVGTRLNTYA